jgi:hypothetical protein
VIDLGITQEGLSEGYGMAYARALDEFHPEAGASSSA